MTLLFKDGNQLITSMNNNPHPYANVPEDYLRVPAFFGLTGLVLKTKGKIILINRVDI